MTRAAALVLVLAVFAPAPAHAGTVSTTDYTHCDPCGSSRYDYGTPAKRFAFAAAPGERNDVVVEPATDFSLRIVDRGAPLEAGAGCEQVTPSEARCPGSRNGEVELGDGDDALTLTWTSFVAVRGGDGDDVINGGASGESIDGGAGTDRVAGGGGNDTLIAPDAGSDGGEGIDVADFQDVTTPVTIRMADFAGVERAIGGSGPDLLIGSEAGEVIEGSGGDDVLAGGGGNDVLEGGDGRDVLRGDGGDDELRTYDDTGDAVVCGPGHDVVRDGDESLADLGITAVFGPNQQDTLAGDCERAAAVRNNVYDVARLIDPRVRTAGDVHSLANPCRRARTRRCRGTLTLSGGGLRRTRRFTRDPLRVALRLPGARLVRVSVDFRVRRARFWAGWTAER